MFEAQITIHLKQGISDPEGANMLKTLHLLGFDTVKQASIFRTIDLLIEGTDEKVVDNNVKKMCQRLLTNPVIHDYKIHIIKKS